MEIIAGFQSLLTVPMISFLLLGVVVGLLLGALPGLDATSGIALLLPVTYAIPPLEALVFFSALYSAVMFGGAITSILFRIPGETAAIMTAIEGHHFTARGEAGIALSISFYASAIGGLIGCLGLYIAAPVLADMALRFGPAEYFALGVLGLSCIASLSSDNVLKGLAAGCFGILLGTVGLDSITGARRFDFGATVLLGGVPLVPACIGLFAASEVFRRILDREPILSTAADGSGVIRYPRFAELLRLKWTTLRASVLGLCIGTLPGAGATTAAIIAYVAETKFSKDPSGFGKGKAEGIAAPEAANNAAAVGAMIPLLSLGIPGSATTAVMIGAFMIHNLQPGPLLFVTHRDLVYGLFAGITVANFVILVASFLLVRIFARLMLIPYPVLATAILTVCVIGSLSYGDLHSVTLMLVFAGIGVAMELARYPLAPVLLGLVLAPVVEVSFRRALLMENHDVVAVFTRPIAGTLLLLTLLILVSPLLKPLWGRVRFISNPSEQLKSKGQGDN
jgi:putative tricarboxylic transport membrane protein